MKIRRKALTLQAWHNSKENRPGGKAPEPIPPWLRSLAEKSAAPDTTFLVTQNDSRFPDIIIHAGDIVYQSPNGSVHSISLERFQQEYDVVDIQPIKQDAKPEDPV